MKGQYLTKPTNLKSNSFYKGSSQPMEQYFIRYLAFQNEIVKKIKYKLNEQ